jgi:8-oxo-dGTP pyrophosphatase MutT (NUDIX family)
MVLNADLPAQLAARLERPLPGRSVQSRFQPELSFGRHFGPAPADARPAAVLILLYPHRQRWHVPMILRPAHMVDHASQVSLPGGVIETGESSQQAALRECTEELGAATDCVQLLGQLSELYLFASNFRITPWVGAVSECPQWSPSAGEVERLLEVPLTHLLNPANIGSMQRHQGPVAYSAPCFHWETHRIWGATSMVLAELVATLEELVI